MGTTWLLTLVAAEWSHISRARVMLFAAAAVMFALVFDGLWTEEPPRWVVLVTLANQCLALALNAWVLGRVVLSRLVAARAPAIVPVGA
jgi:hypothetical protein